jgi:ribosome-associated protein
MAITIPEDELIESFVRSSGPGGQHAQRSETRVEAILDVEGSEALTEAQKKRVVARAGPTLRAIAQDERSQWRNRELCLAKLIERRTVGDRIVVYGGSAVIVLLIIIVSTVHPFIQS